MLPWSSFVSSCLRGSSILRSPRPRNRRRTKKRRPAPQNKKARVLHCIVLARVLDPRVHVVVAELRVGGSHLGRRARADRRVDRLRLLLVHRAPMFITDIARGMAAEHRG